MAGNNVEWTSDQMIENANSWSLAGDVALLNRLRKFSESLLSETELVSANVDNLLNNLENINLKLDLTKNEFQSLRNTQFIENRVYEDDETLDNEENKKEEKELTEEEKENAVKESIVKGLAVMQKYFEKIEVAVSDSEEEENEKSFILQPKDPYADRPLPYLVGSQDWYKKWHVGLLPSESESESEKEEEVYSSSDSEQYLPKNRNLGSETSSELDFNNRNTGPVANSTFNPQNREREIYHSSDDSSEQSNSLPVKVPISNENFAEQLAAKLGDVINNSAENSEHVNRNPIKKMKQTTKYGNLFSDEPPPLDDLDDTVLPKSAHEGLFSGGRDLFVDSTEDDLFWDQPNNSGQNKKNIEEKEDLFSNQEQKSGLKVSKGLFDESDSSEEDDIFTVAEKRKVKVAQPYLKPFKPAVPFVDEQPPEITPKSETTPSKKKPIGGVSIFGENANMFGETSGKPGFEATKSVTTSHPAQDIEPKSTEALKKSLKKKSLFDESSDEDVITPKNKSTVSKNSENQQIVKKLTLFDDTDDILPVKTEETLKKHEENKKPNLFEDVDDVPTSAKKLGLFDESKAVNENKKPVKKISLFDDDDDLLNEERDIFAPVPRKKGLFEDPGEKPESITSKGLFEDTQHDPSKETSSGNKSKGLFDNLGTKKSSEIMTQSSQVNNKEAEKDSRTLSKERLEKEPTTTLFDDLESSESFDDLFGGIKAQNTAQKEKATKSLFEDTESSTSIGDFLEGSTEKGIDIKSSEKIENSSKVPSRDDTNEKATKSHEGYGKSREEDSLSKGSSIENINSELSGRVAVKPKKTGLFDDSDNDFFGQNTSEDVEQKSEFSVAKVEITDNLFAIEGVTKKEDVKEIKEAVIEKRIVEEEISEDRTGSGAIDNMENPERDEPKTSNRDESEDDLRQSKSNLLGKIRKSVGFLDSDDDGSSDDSFGFNKNVKEDKQSDFNDKVAAGGKSEDLTDNHLVKAKEPKLFGFSEQKYDEHISGHSKDKLESNVNINESPPKIEETSKSNTSKNYTMPPPIDLFDPTPPPIDWDAGSDSGESDTFSLSDGILNQTNFNQSEARFRLFDEVPPSLDANDSSGIVRDLNVTGVETDDSSFYPYASSSRRFSGDIFGEQQSQDGFFVTKSRTDMSAQAGSSLDQIPEKVDESSKIVNLTPSGNLEDFEGSSVFEGSKNQSKDSENMENTASVSEIKETQSENGTGHIFASKSSDNVKQRASLFEVKSNLEKERKPKEQDGDGEEKSPTSPIKTSPGKLQHNLKINVNALMPGAARPKLRPAADEPDKAASNPLEGGTSVAPPPISHVATPEKKYSGDLHKTAVLEGEEKLDSLAQTKVLISATKDRVRIPVKRRPSTRKARQEAVRKSMTDFSLYENEENPSFEGQSSGNDQSPSGDNKTGFLKDLDNKLGVSDDLPKKETLKNKDDVKDSKENREAKGISLVFDQRDEEQRLTKELVKSPIKKYLLGGSLKETENSKPISSGISIDVKSEASKPVETLKPKDVASKSLKILGTEDPKPESKSSFDDFFKEDLDLFKTTSQADDISRKPKGDSDLFGDGGSDDSNEDLFSSTTKPVRKDLDTLVDKPSKVEDTSSKKDSKPSIFSDKSDSEGEGELFGAKPKVVTGRVGKKMVSEMPKKVSIFDDSDDDSEEDLFSSKTSKTSGGLGENPGSSVSGTRRIGSKNVKVASVKKLENKEVTDFDPLSALK